MKDRFIVKNYFCEPSKLEHEMNEHFIDGYYPMKIKLEPYQNRVQGFIIYELGMNLNELP